MPGKVPQILLQHHERINGSGYPYGLTAPEILLEAKILAVADVVEAMCSHRPYRPALGIEKALEEIEENKGVLYDPEVVDHCLQLYQELPTNLMGEICYLSWKPAVPLDSLPRKEAVAAPESCLEKKVGRWNWERLVAKQPHFFRQLATGLAIGLCIFYVGRFA